MIFGNNPVILYLKNNQIDVYKKGFERVSITIPETAIQNQEVKDVNQLEQAIASFIQQSKIGKPQAILVLSENVYYHRIIPASDQENEQHEIQQFLDQIPFEKPSLAAKIIQNKTEIMILAANKNYFYEVKNIFEKYGWRIDIVAPSGLFGNFTDGQLTQDDIVAILNDRSDLKTGNFLVATKTADELIKSDPEKVSQKTGGSFLKTFVFLLIVVVLLLGSALYLGKQLGILNLNLLQRPQPAQKALNTTTTEAIASATPEASSSADFSKADAKVEVLNGSGVAGQASKVKEQLVTLGYQNIETGNATESGATSTTVGLSSKVSDPAKSELKTILEKAFSKVVFDNNPDAGFDISIVTGEAL